MPVANRTSSRANQKLYDLSNNNEAPSDIEVLGVKDFLLTPSKQLEETDSNIARLEGVLQSLKEKRAEIQESIDRYTRILAPVRRIPADILHEIFFCCLPPSRNSNMSASESPVLVSHICRTWRLIALSSPLLWAQIHLDIHPYNEPFIPTHCRAIEEWLSRSGTCPLSISISPKNGHHIYSEDAEIIVPYLTSVALFSSRWRFLSLYLPLVICHQLESLVSMEMLTMLFELRITVRRSSSLPELLPLDLLKAPNLKSVVVHLSQNDTEIWPSLDISDAYASSGIMDLYINSNFTCEEYLTLLKNFPLLVYCHIHTDGSGDVEALGVAPVQLPYLEYLCVNDSSGDPGGWFTSSRPNRLYDYISAPQLRTIDFRLNAVSHTIDDNIYSNIFPWVENAKMLQTFIISRLALSRNNMLKALKSLSCTLTHLCLNTTYARTYYIEAAEALDLFIFDLLVIDHSQPGTTGNNLLPRLESFEIYFTPVSDDIILRFVTSRMVPLSPAASVLRAVKICFLKEQEQGGINLADEIQQHAAMAGIHIDTYIWYHPVAQYSSLTSAAIEGDSSRQDINHTENEIPIEDNNETPEAHDSTQNDDSTDDGEHTGDESPTESIEGDHLTLEDETTQAAAEIAE